MREGVKIGQDMVSASYARIGVAHLLTLSLLTGIAPFAIDLYLPAFPEMVVDLATTSAGVQLSLTTFLVGAGFGQLIFGPLSDRVGRIGPLVSGICLYLVASVAAALAPTINTFVIARFAQGLTGAAGMVISRAIITDLVRGYEAARAMSIVMLVSGISPVIAPVVGSMLVNPLGWRGLMWILTALVGIGLVAVLLFVRESRPHVMCESKYRTAGVTTVRTLISRTYLGNMLAFVFAFTGMMAYISASPFLYQTLMGMNEIKYGLVFGFNALALMIVGAVSARLTRRRVCVAKIARAGLLINLTAVASLALLVSTSVPPIWFAVPILFAVGSLGLVFGNTIALALAAVPAAAGFASAVLGMLQHVLAGAVAPLVGIAGEHTALPLSLTMLAASVIANLAFAASTRTRC